MQDAFLRDVVERLGVAGGAAAIRLGHVIRRRQRQGIGQCLSGQQGRATARAALVRAAPDFRGPVGRPAGLVEQRVQLHHHGRALRLVDEFLLAPPAHAQRHARHLHRGNGGVGGGIVGAIVPVTAGALHVMHGDGGRLELERTRQRGAQREDALAMRPHRQMTVLVKRQPARRRDRGMREILLAVGRLEALPALRIGGLGRAQRAVDGRPLQQPARLLLRRHRRFDVLPGDVRHGRRRRGLDRGLVVADDGEEVAVAHEGDRRLGGALDGGLVDRGDGGAAVGLAHHARMLHAGQRHVVDESGRAENLSRQVEPRRIGADGVVVGGRFARAGAARIDGEIDGRGERPVVLAGALSVAQDLAIADVERVRRAADDLCRLIEKQRAHIGAGLAQGDAAELHRLAAGGVTLVGRQRGVARRDGDAA